MMPIDITPVNVAMFVIPFFMGFFFYYKASKKELDQERLILMGFSVLSFVIWAFYLYRFSMPLLTLFNI